MPSFRIEASTVSLNVFDVVGTDGDQPEFIGHTGLAESEGLHRADAISILDMGPPMHGSSQTHSVHANALGRAELSNDEMQKIRTFVNQHESEHQAFLNLTRTQLLRLASQIYCIFPHADPFCETDGRYSRTRFSCSGFVFEAYRAARITLLETDALPLIDLVAIKAAYPSEAGLMESRKVTPDSLGLKGVGPWRVLLCGYLLHALDRPADVIRRNVYAPRADDRYFSRDNVREGNG